MTYKSVGKKTCALSFLDVSNMRSRLSEVIHARRQLQIYRLPACLDAFEQ